MPSTLSMSLQLPSKETLSKSNDLLPLAILNSAIQSEIRKLPPVQTRFPAIIAVSQLTDEFLMNAIDAGATEISLEVNVMDDEIQCVFKDNGAGIPAEKTGHYQWRTAILSESSKKISNETLGGKNLGLAICAHFLETEGNGKLCLSNRADATQGAVVILTSHFNELLDFDILEEGLNYKRMMLKQLSEEPTSDPEKIEEMLRRSPLRPGEYEARRQTPFSSRDNSATSLSPISRDSSSVPESSYLLPITTSNKKRRPPSLFSNTSSPNGSSPGNTPTPINASFGAIYTSPSPSADNKNISNFVNP